MSLPTSTIDEIDALIRRDPAGRGLISGESLFGPLCPGHLARAAVELATRGRRAGIVTGFFVPEAVPPSAETDGPPGAVVLGLALASIGIETTLVTDAPCAPALRAAARAADLDLGSIAVCPQVADPQCRPWIDRFFDTEPGRSLTHLIAIERVGPSHTEASLVRQPRTGPPPVAEFLAAVPAGNRDRCHNARGRVIDDSTSPLHRLFEMAKQRTPPLTTIGIGDGGNEIGMGTVPWEDLVRRLPHKESAAIPCRIAADWNIVAGTSNWGGFALAASSLSIAGRIERLAPIDEEFHGRMLQQMVAEGPAVDGMTRASQPTVDGLPFTTYIQIWAGIRRLLGLS